MFPGNGTRFNVGQWYLKNDGNSYIGGAAGADTKAWKAWDITIGNPNVVVAIFDTGISMNGQGQLNHPDLSDVNRIILGRKYVGSNTDTLSVAEEYAANNCYHGTWMSGIVGATQNNSTGISGIAPEAGLLVMKVMSTLACGTTAANVLKGVHYLERYSNDNPEKRIIANFSFGGSGSVPPIFQTIFDETYLNNILVVVSAGNTDAGAVNSPAKLAAETPQSTNHFVSVGSSTHRDEISFRSAQASATEEITLAAPAGPDYEIYYGWPYGTWLTDAVTTGNPLDATANQAHTATDYYRYAGLTSGAAAMTSGAAALVWSVNPNLTNYQVKQILKNSADKVPAMGGQNYHNRFGYGRLNAYKAVKAALPKAGTSITSNTTWSGYVHVENTVTIGNNATLTIQPGTAILLGQNRNIVVQPGAKIIAKGTQANPITFKRVDPAQAWGAVILRSSAGNEFEWALFDGGTETVSIQSNNNLFAHSTFRNGWRGMEGWTNQDGAGNSSATITYSLFETNTSVGLVANYLDLNINYTTIRNNTQAGLYIISSTVSPFHNNLVTGNGGTTRDGIEVQSSGTLWMQKVVYEDGYNEVFNNGEDQISTYGSLLVGTSTAPGLRNAVYGNYSGTRYLIENNSGTSVNAYRTFWGGSPVSGMFTGTVNTSNHLGSNPTTGVPHGHGGQSPSKAWSEAIGPPSIAGIYDDAESNLGRAETPQQVRDALQELYQLAGLSKDPALKERFNKTARAAADGSLGLYAPGARNTAFRNFARVLYAKSLMRDGNYDEAEAWLEKTSDEALTGYDRRDWLHLTSVVQAYHGQYGQALETLQAYYAFQKAQGEDPEETRNSHSPFEEDLLARLGGSGREELVWEARAGSEEPTVQAYPNPFNPVTTISFMLPTSSEIRLTVFDLLGREVAVLAAGRQEAGMHQIPFNASQLSTGIYIYRLQVGGNIYTRKMMLIK